MRKSDPEQEGTVSRTIVIDPSSFMVAFGCNFCFRVTVTLDLNFQCYKVIDMLGENVLYPSTAPEKGLSDEFSRVLLGSIEEGLVQILGETAANTILTHLERHKRLKREEIPHKVEEFSYNLTELLGPVVTHILERLSLKLLCSKLQIEYDMNSDCTFTEYIHELKKRFEA